MTRKEFAGGAPATTLDGAINNSVETFSVADGTGYPTGTNPFVICIDRGTVNEEKVLCSARSGTTFTVESGGRGYDDTTAVSHSDNAVVEHVLDATTIDEANRHANDGDSVVHAASKISATSSAPLVGDDVQEIITSVGSFLAEQETTNTDFNDRIATLEAADPSAGVLAYKAYSPGTLQNISATDTIADVDATNLSVAFTAPASGDILVTLSAFATAAVSSYTELSWALREGSTTVSDIRVAVAGADNTAGTPTVSFVITGLTPSSAHTYKWAHERTSGTGSAQTQYGGAVGAAIMTVSALP